MKSIDGYLKLNANTLGVIAENYDLIYSNFSKKGINLITLLNVDSCILDKGNYISISIDDKVINKYFKDSIIESDNTFIYEILEETCENLGLKDLNLTQYLPKSQYKDTLLSVSESIDFKDKENIIKYGIDIKSKFNPSKEYDFIYPIVKNNIQKVRKNFKIGLIDAITGAEIIPCKYNLVQKFDFATSIHRIPLQRAKDNYLKPCFVD